MRRLYIIFYWLFGSRNNVTFSELIRFLTKTKVKKIASRYIETITERQHFYEISFTPIKERLFWPREYPLDGVYQVATETFDPDDWHFYQKKYTEVQQDEQILDVGAAEGLFALTVIDRCKKIIMIEPNDFFYHSLRKTFENYGQKIKIYNLAVGNTEGEIVFDQNSLSGHIDHDNQKGTKKVISKIDTILQDETRITYLKADLEGYEMEMLRGASQTIKKHKPKIAITTYHSENNSLDIINYVKGLVPQYEFYTKGVFHQQGKPVMVHFWIPEQDGA